MTDTGPTEPPARHPNRAARRAYLGNTIGYPLRSGNKASRRQGARMAWRHGVILAMCKAQAEALAEKVK